MYSYILYGLIWRVDQWDQMSDDTLRVDVFKVGILKVDNMALPHCLKIVSLIYFMVSEIDTLQNFVRQYAILP